MKKIIIAILALFWSPTAYAGLYYNYSVSISEYDQDSGYYLKEVSLSEEGGFLKGKNTKTIDIYIHYPAEDKGAYVFNGNNKDKIVVVLYETAFNKETNSIIFNYQNNESVIKNNIGIKKRNIKQQILIETYNKETETYTLWITNKRGENVRKIKQLSKDIDWHIDVLNSKLRLVKQVEKSIIIENLEW